VKSTEEIQRVGEIKTEEKQRCADLVKSIKITK
jgi:hypothetical protein